MKNSFILVSAFFLIYTSLFAQKSVSVGVVDVQRVLNDYSAFQAAVEKVRGSVAPVEEEMQKMQENIMMNSRRKFMFCKVPTWKKRGESKSSTHL